MIRMFQTNGHYQSQGERATQQSHDVRGDKIGTHLGSVHPRGTNGSDELGAKYFELSTWQHNKEQIQFGSTDFPGSWTVHQTVLAEIVWGPSWRLSESVRISIKSLLSWLSL